MSQLEPHNIYVATIYLFNSFNVIEDQDNATICKAHTCIIIIIIPHIHAATYHVQDLKIIAKYHDGSVVIKCVVIVQSTAEKCHVIFTDSAGFSTSFTITGSVNTRVFIPSSGSYTVKVYDIVNGLFFGPAIVNSNVTILSLSKHNHSLAFIYICFNTYSI